MKTLPASKNPFVRQVASLATCLLASLVALIPSPALAAIVQQLEPFYYPNGTVVVSDNGEPDDAVLIRSFDTQREGLMWQLMTQHLTPGAWYDVWLEGTNDGTAAGAFLWWVGRARATPQGEINATGKVYVDIPLGPATGRFTNSRAAANLVIRDTNGNAVQTAHFSAI